MHSENLALREDLDQSAMFEEIVGSSAALREVLAQVRAYPKLIYYNRVDKGGHFAGWEQPEILVTELRAAFRSLR